VGRHAQRGHAGRRGVWWVSLAAVSGVATVALGAVFWAALPWPAVDTGSTTSEVPVAGAGATQSGPASASTTASPTPVRPARRAGTVAAEAPTSARLPSGRRVRVVAVASTTDGLLDVPADINVAGWWRGGSRIGDPFGSTLLAAHVDSRTRGLGPYVELLSVQAGDRIVVTTAQLRQTFRVRSLRVVARGSLTQATWIYSPSGARRLTLVTCTGPYVRSAGGYQNLAVVTALPTGPPERLKA
jgi:hypothetical protein